MEAWPLPVYFDPATVFLNPETLLSLSLPNLEPLELLDFLVAESFLFRAVVFLIPAENGSLELLEPRDPLATCFTSGT